MNLRLFLTSKVRLHCDVFGGVEDLVACLLFLTSKVRLHCDQLPVGGVEVGEPLFLTSKVRLHCDRFSPLPCWDASHLFLTSKVRLHCDTAEAFSRANPQEAFPDLKGQAPLRHATHGAFPQNDTFS